MRGSLFILLSVLSYNVVAGNWFFDVVKGVQEGIEDAYSKGQLNIDHVKDKVKQTIDDHPTLNNNHKIKLHKLIKEAGKDVEKWHKKFLKKYGLKEKKQAKKNFHKQWNMINKWMTNLTKTDRDGEQQHNIPFIPRLILKKDRVIGKGQNKKAVKIFKKFAKMWEEETKSKVADEEKEEVPLLGRDYEKILPKFEEGVGKFDKYAEKGLHLVGAEEGKIQRFGQDEKNIEPEAEKKMVFGENEEAENLKRIASEKAPSLSNEEKEKLISFMATLARKPISKEEILKEGKAQAEDWGKELNLPVKDNTKKSKEFEDFLGKGLEVIPAEDKKETMDTKKMLGSIEEKVKNSEESKGLKEAEKKVSEEQLMFEEAEKEWVEEMKKKAEEKQEVLKLTTQQQEIEEEMKEAADNTFTPSEDEDMPQTTPSVETLPQVFFKFDDFDDNFKKGMRKEEEPLPSVPERVSEPVSLFAGSKSEQGFEKMSEIIKPFFKEIDDTAFRRKALAEEAEWNRMKKFFKRKLFKASKKAAQLKKHEEYKIKNVFKEPTGYIEE